jgi:hypothetical protein
MTGDAINKTEMLISLVPTFIATSFLTGLPAVSQTSSGDPSNAYCVERLDIPAYPLLAMQARITGTVTATVHLSARAAAQDVMAVSSPKIGRAKAILTEPVEAVIREARFRPACGGKIVTLIFRFELIGETENRPSQRLLFGYPNRFWIVDETPLWQPDTPGNCTP